MSVLEKNIQRQVASRVLKDIHRIVDEENKKEQQESHWRFVFIGLLGCVVVALVIYLNIQ